MFQRCRCVLRVPTVRRLEKGMEIVTRVPRFPSFLLSEYHLARYE